MVRGPRAVGIRDHTHCVSAMTRFRADHREGPPKAAEGKFRGVGDRIRIGGSWKASWRRWALVEVLKDILTSP